MQYNFDQIIDRRGTDALKIDAVPNIWGRDDLMPLWVADMDFATPPFIVEALRRRMEHEVIGYTVRTPQWASSIVAWQQSRYGWQIQPEWLNFVPGIVPGIAFVISCFTEPGDAILIQPPVYHPYIHVPTNLGRTLRRNQLDLVDGQYQIDFERFERDVRGCKLFLLCHPHNPGGRVWSEEELRRIAEICHREGVIVVSDEIHADLTLPPYQHVPFAKVSAEAAECSITLMSPSKAFNMAGLTSSYSIISNEALRERFHRHLEHSELNLGHAFAFISVAAAYSHGTEWLDQMLAYVQGNIDYMEQYLATSLPQVGMIRPQASYLVFLDFRKLGLSQAELNTLIVDKARLALNDGAMFEGEGFMRLNAASPRSVIEEAMRRLSEAVQG
ncbi:MAG: pyridoxal phosphate-dependent aminotransferase [Bacteroidaceae bacterium]|nr:pyridoxal phosphate-dependent aminotransferase [Bacteroidaceae bacterium]